MTVVEERHHLWEGPLPPPQTLEHFRELVPDAPERIFAQWELEATHRRDYEKTALRAAISRERLGQLGAIAFAMAALGVTAYCAYLDRPWVAGVLGGGTITAVVTAFLYARRQSKQPPTGKNGRE